MQYLIEYTSITYQITILPMYVYVYQMDAQYFPRETNASVRKVLNLEKRDVEFSFRESH